LWDYCNLNPEYFQEDQSLLNKKFSEDDLIRVLNHSSLKQPVRLAKLLEEHVFSKRTRTKFLNELLKQESIKEKIKEVVVVKDQKGLGDFF